MGPVILLYNLGAERPEGSALRKILFSMGLPARTVHKAQLGEKIGVLAGLPGYDAPAESVDTSDQSPNSDEHLMVMCGITNDQLDQLLAEMRQAKIRIPYKAMLTETNRDFTASELLTEIMKEHKMMLLMEQMRKKN